MTLEKVGQVLTVITVTFAIVILILSATVSSLWVRVKRLEDRKP
jgi:hypothetical protein